MEVKLDVPASVSHGIGTVLRQYCMSNVPTWAVVGFSVENGVSIMGIENIKETTADIIHALSLCTFVPKKAIGDADFVREIIDVSGPMTVSGLDSKLHSLAVTSDSDHTIMTHLTGTLRLELFFRLARGDRDYNSNEGFLETNGVRIGNTCLAMRSHHCAVKNFKYDIRPSSEEMVTLVFTCDDESLIREALSGTISILQGCLTKME